MSGSRQFKQRDVSQRANEAVNQGMIAAPKAAPCSRTRSSTTDKGTAGPGWFDMVPTESSAELEADLRLLSMRGALDPKHHYRRGVVDTIKANGKRRDGSKPMVQLGTVIEPAIGYYTDRLTRKQRAQTMLDTLMRDVEKQQFLKRKYQTLQDASRSRYGGGGRGKSNRKQFRKDRI